MAALYAWIVDKDHTEQGNGDAGVTGPRGASETLIHQLRSDKRSGQCFRMYDDDKELYYSGRLVGDYNGLEPLDDFGMPYAGCTYIELKGEVDKKWHMV